LIKFTAVWLLSDRRLFFVPKGEIKKKDETKTGEKSQKSPNVNHNFTNKE
jgi:hypothetical protein